MALHFPSAAELRDEQEPGEIQAVSRDTCWSVKLKDDADLEPADVHGA
ncbi:hypothetical protein [Actinomadura fibrosa]|uniref:DUF397 domain-containing protein n=1 Tax=Actinomadura fibrosa TaxID=111802 RepID=A0ABW2XL48_9ACTN|nr:hypothetical protein [Actinomadura fibrosa]